MQKWMFVSLFILVASDTRIAIGQGAESSDSVPIATQWLLDAAGPASETEIKSVFKIFCPKTGMLGTGFALDTNYIISNAHVVGTCGAADLNILSSTGKQVAATSLATDSNRDLAVMKVALPPGCTGLRIKDDLKTKIGTYYTTWGYPYAHPGPAPLWNFGHLSGFKQVMADDDPKTIAVKHYVLVGAFNPGNSGGPLLADGAVAGVVVSKQIFSLTPFLASALDVLSKNQSGITFEATDGNGKKVSFTESQLTAELLKYYRYVSQIVIGEAIAVEELIAFLNANHISWHHVEKPTSQKTGALQRK